MCESEVALEHFWTSSHILEVTIWSHYLIYIAETPEHLLKMKIDFLPSISLQSFQSHCVTLFCRDIDNPSSFSFRMKSQCTHRSSCFYPIKIWHTSEYLPGNRMHSEAEVSHLFSLSTRHIADHILFRRHFYYHHTWWTTKRRCKIWHFDNVEKPKTTNNFYLDSCPVD